MVGCGTSGSSGGGRVGTLLGPEASGPRNVLPALAGVGLLGFVFLVALSFVCWSPVGGWWGLVGLLFEICIVDASIN